MRFAALAFVVSLPGLAASLHAQNTGAVVSASTTRTREASVSGTWSLSRAGQANAPTATLVLQLDGTNLSASGPGWRGAGRFDGRSGHYTWEFSSGQIGRTDLLLDDKGVLHGKVRGSSLDWDFIGVLQSPLAESARAPRSQVPAAGTVLGPDRTATAATAISSPARFSGSASASSMGSRAGAQGTELASAERTRADAERGDPNAQYELASLLAAGQGVPQDRAAARAWLQKAAAAGHALAASRLAYENAHTKFLATLSDLRRISQGQLVGLHLQQLELDAAHERLLKNQDAPSPEQIEARVESLTKDLWKIVDAVVERAVTSLERPRRANGQPKTVSSIEIDLGRALFLTQLREKYEPEDLAKRIFAARPATWQELVPIIDQFLLDAVRARTASCLPARC